MFNEVLSEKVRKKYPGSRFDGWPVLQLWNSEILSIGSMLIGLCKLLADDLHSGQVSSLVEFLSAMSSGQFVLVVGISWLPGY